MQNEIAQNPRLVAAAYEALLGREISGDELLTYIKATDVSQESFLQSLVNSLEYKIRTYKTDSSRFWDINTDQVDFIDLIMRYAKNDRTPVEGHIVNFLGVAMNVDFMPDLNLPANVLDPVPIPANYHADMAEWAAILRAVDLAKDRFTCIELGCGWAACLTNAGTAAKSRGLDVRLIGVEGDPGYVTFARECLTTNGFAEQEFTIERGIAGAGEGFAFFPKQDRTGSNWGLEPVFTDDSAVREKLSQSGDYEEIEIVPLPRILESTDRVDLLHMDIQGGEDELVRSTIDVLSDKVAYCFVGTHSRQIEGRMLDAFYAAGWKLEIERPAVIDLPDGAAYTRIDGVQAWRNPRLL